MKWKWNNNERIGSTKRTHFPSLKIIRVPANNSGRILVQSEMEAMSLKIVREREREDNTSVSVPRQNWLNTEEYRFRKTC